MFCWKTSGSGFNVDGTLKRTIHIYITADQVQAHPLTPMPLPKPRPTHPSRIMYSYTTKISFWDGLKDMTKSSALTWPQNSPDLNPIKHSWDAVEQQPEQRPHSPTPQNPKELLPMIWCQAPQDTIRPVCCPCLDRSELLH